MALRSITRLVEPTHKGIIRLVGTLDVKGKGTEHSLESVDPVVLFDDSGVVFGKDLPPFGKHPHYGLIAITYILEGKFSDWDCLTGAASHFNEVGDIYACSAGIGVVHSEKSEDEKNNRALQTVLRIPLDKLKQFPEPSITRAKADAQPVVSIDGGFVRVLVGNLNGTQSPATLPTLPDYLMTRVTINPMKTVKVSFPSQLTHGYAYVLEGCVKIAGDDKLFEPNKALILFGSGQDLQIENVNADSEASVLVILGKTINDSWVKLLGRNGFIIARDEKVGDKVMAKIHEREDEFSYKDLDFTELHQ